MRLILRAEVVIISAGMLALPALGAMTLHRLSTLQWLTIDWADPMGWIAHTPPEDITAAILRHLGLIGCYWLSAASVAYTAGRLAGFSRVVAALGPVTPRIVRSVADRVVVGAVALSSLGISPMPALADRHQPPTPNPIEIRTTVGESDVDPPAVALVRDDYLPYAPRSPIAPDTQSESREPSAETLAAVTRVRDDYLPHESHAPTPSDLEGAVEVQTGDSLWLIAERHLTTGLARPPTQEELRVHWRATIDTNLPTLRSGNPDVIHPGEIITLPPTGRR